MNTAALELPRFSFLQLRCFSTKIFISVGFTSIEPVYISQYHEYFFAQAIILSLFLSFFFVMYPCFINISFSVLK